MSGGRYSAVQRFYTVDELAARWGVSDRHVRRLVSEKRIPVVRLGGRVVRLDARDVDAFERASREEAVHVHPLLARRALRPTRVRGGDHTTNRAPPPPAA
jgi:excisionase family DNA binding protein